MKNKIKQNDGFAIISVIFLLFVLSLMGTAMFMYSITSLRSVRFLSDRKKAEYLAQAGVESAAYAYQLAVSGSGNIQAANTLINDTTEEGSVIDSNVVYLVYDHSAQENNHYKFVKENAIGAYSDDQVIGYYTAKITSSVDKSVVNLIREDTTSNSGIVSYPVEIDEAQRLIEATGHVGKKGAGGVAATKKAYLSEPVQALGKFYMSNGIIDGSVTSNNKTINYTENSVDKSANVPIATNNNFNVLGSYRTGSSLTIKVSLFNNIPFIGQYIGTENTRELTIDQQNVPILMAYTSGNMIMNQPQTGTIKFKERQSNMVSFVGKKNLFVNTNIDVTPDKKHFNALYLRGDTIVLNGDVEIYVYGFTRAASSLLGRLAGQNATSMYQAIAGNYCWSTVVIGTSNPETSTTSDPVHSSIYTLAPQMTGTGIVSPSQGGYGKCGKIFFGGNVFINIQIPNVGTYRYKAFDAGDAYYFDDNLPQSIGMREGYGIDLFKYFIDYSIATKQYSDDVLSRFAEVMGMYYSTTNNTPVTYVVGDNSGNIIYNAMRKIDKDKFDDDTFRSLIPPDPTDGSSLTWVKG